MSAEQPPLLPAHRKFLSVRAVDDGVATERGYQSAVKKSDLLRLGFGRTQQLAPAIVIPIWSVRRAVESYQLRPDKPRLDDKGKARKYEMKAGSNMLLDAHPRLTRRRGGSNISLLADPKVPLFITEGVPKGDAAVSIGLCCIALLGVWNWRGSNEAKGKAALADWDSIVLNGRVVYIAFDSDVMEQRQVHSALTRLKPFLKSRGAAVKVIYLPRGDHGEKVGLDDYIAQKKLAKCTDGEIRDGLCALASDELIQPATETKEDQRPEIAIVAGKAPEIVDAAERVLVAHAARLQVFQRAGEIVRIVTLERESTDGELWRPAGTVQLVPASGVNLQEIFDRLISWSRIRGDEVKPADCPMRFANTYVARGQWKLSHLRGIIEAPILRPDGTLLQTPGYDSATGLFFHSEENWPLVPDQPTRAQAQAAVRTLLEPFSEFPFVDDSARYVVIAGI
jgi:hypothetical protein